MEVQNTPSSLRIIVCDGNAEARSQLAELLVAIHTDHRVTRFGEGDEICEDFALAACDADLVVIAGDAHHELTTAMRRHIRIAAALGVSNILLIPHETQADDVHQAGFMELRGKFEAYLEYVSQSDCGIFTATMVSFEHANSIWHDGSKLPEVLSACENLQTGENDAFRMPVGSVSGTNFASGKVLCGTISTGEKVIILPSAIRTVIEQIECDGENVEKVQFGQSARLGLPSQINVAPGDMICSADNPVEAADQFETTLIWLARGTDDIRPPL